jgi:AraC family transcriptional regulator of adaptative response/methylated-DNA-[protein]-cysteine methyltransferase
MEAELELARTDERRWAAVQANDAGADDTFFYGVLTTGVFCRPSCPSRMRRRANVRFFDTAAEAERTGLRACKRCQPTGQGIVARRAGLMANACRIIDEAEVPPDLVALAAEIGVSRFHLHRVFKEETGITPKAYGDASRASRVRRSLVRAGRSQARSVHRSELDVATAPELRRH